MILLCHTALRTLNSIFSCPLIPFFSHRFPQNSLGPSGPNSTTTHDLTGALVREAGSSPAPAFMASLQQGFQELSPGQAEQLRADISTLKSNYRRTTVSTATAHTRMRHTLRPHLCRRSSCALTSARSRATTTGRPSVPQPHTRMHSL